MTIEEIKKAQEEINLEIIERSKNPNYNFDKGYIVDGVADIEAYIETKPRIAWILKEAWDKEIGDWYMSDLIREKYIKNISTCSTFKNVAYVSYGIQNNLLWDDIPWIYKEQEVVDALKSIAWLNISKIAGDTTSPDARITSAYEVWNDILKKQLNIFDPQIIILGNTLKWVQNLFSIENLDYIKYNSAHAYVLPDKKIIIDAYHPSSTQDTNEKYTDNIVNVIRLAKEKYNIEF